jgi:hypothetical protein
VLERAGAFPGFKSYSVGGARLPGTDDSWWNGLQVANATAETASRRKRGLNTGPSAGRTCEKPGPAIAPLEYHALLTKRLINTTLYWTQGQ